MLLKSFEIQNFRSIKRVSCDTSNKITIFAGKNESGKSNVLDALTRINGGIEFNDEDVPQHFSADAPAEITYKFEVTTEEKKELVKKITFIEELQNSDVMIKYWPKENTYEISGELYDEIKNALENPSEQILAKINKHISLLNQDLKKEKIDFTVESIQDFSEDSINKLIEDLQQAENLLPTTPPTKEKPNPSPHPLALKIDAFRSQIQSLNSSERSEKLAPTIWSMRPKVVLFSSFRDTLPHEVPYAEFTNFETLKNNHPIVYDLVKFAELDESKLQTTNRLTRYNVTQKASTISSKKFSGFWDQNPIEFVFDIDSETASIFIRDEGKSHAYKPEQRSEGFQWFLSFFLRLESAGQKKNNIIIVDEPGLYLHFRAQKDVQKVFEKLSENNQVIFTTHSPYLFNPERLNQVRLVMKTDETTEIKNSFHEGGTDFDTLSPIITALGLDVTKDLFFSKLGYNIIVEGVSDYYYLEGMKEYLKTNEQYDFPKTISLVPCMGHTTVSLMVSFLIALQLKYKILLDRKGTTQTYNKLKKDGIHETKILFAGQKEKESIENLFHEDDIKKFNLISDEVSKGIIARTFLEKITTNKVKLHPQTIEKFKNLLDELKKEIIPPEVDYLIKDLLEKIDDSKSPSITKQH